MPTLKRVNEYYLQPYNPFTFLEEAAIDMSRVADEMKEACTHWEESNDKMIEALTKEACNDCWDLSKVEGEYPEELHEGKQLVCGTCNAEYYEEWGSERRYATNDQAKKNHPELKTL